MSFDRAAAAARFERKPFPAGSNPAAFYVFKPRVREYLRFLDLVRKCHSEQQAAGPGAEFDPAGLTDLDLVRISTQEEDGAPVFATCEDVEEALSPTEIIDVAIMARDLITPQVNPTTAPPLQS